MGKKVNIELIKDKLRNNFTAEEIRFLYLNKNKILIKDYPPYIERKCKREICENTFITRTKQIYCCGNCQRRDFQIEKKCEICGEIFKPFNTKGLLPSTCSIKCYQKKYQKNIKKNKS